MSPFRKSLWGFSHLTLDIIETKGIFWAASESRLSKRIPTETGATNTSEHICFMEVLDIVHIGLDLEASQIVFLVSRVGILEYGYRRLGDTEISPLLRFLSLLYGSNEHGALTWSPWKEWQVLVDGISSFGFFALFRSTLLEE